MARKRHTVIYTDKQIGKKLARDDAHEAASVDTLREVR